MQKLTLLSILVISAVLGITVAMAQLAYVQASSNESGTIQCITTPCDFPPSQTTSNESGTIQCITTPCEFPSPQPMPLPPESDSSNDTITTPKKDVELPTEGQNGTNQNEPCISPCPPGSEVCIQMCQPAGQSNAPIEETESPNDPKQEVNSSSGLDTTSSDTTATTLEEEEEEKPTINDDQGETSDTESSKSS